MYRLQLALGGAGLAGAAIVLAVAVSAVDVAPAAAHHLRVAGLGFTYPALNAAAALLLAFAALGAAVLIVTVRAAWRQVRGHRRLVRALPVAGKLPGDPSVTVIGGDEPLAFCAGRMANCAPVPGLTDSTVPVNWASGKVSIIAPGTIASFEEFAIGENVVAGNAMSQRAGYAFGSLLDLGSTGTVSCGIGIGTDRGATIS